MRVQAGTAVLRRPIWPCILETVSRSWHVCVS